MKLLTSVAATGSLAAAFAGTALAEPGASTDFGGQAAMCAQQHLGQREGAPGVTCTHDGMTMTFANFGAIVEHMRAMG